MIIAHRFDVDSVEECELTVLPYLNTGEERELHSMRRLLHDNPWSKSVLLTSLVFQE